ncbi:MAG TPA: hypothetical protein VHM90_07110 [Phycisphaerae bacterium]|nr:hypothetical protein [Phycisphaerae bacterium]
MRPGKGEFLVIRLEADGAEMAPRVPIYRVSQYAMTPKRKVRDIVPAADRREAAERMALFLDVAEDVDPARRMAGVHHLAVEDAVGNRQRFEVKCTWAARACGPQSIVDAKYEAREVIGG